VITENIEGDVADIGIRLADEAYLAWLAAASESERALHDWFDAAWGRAATSYCAYRAALDREEAAASDLRRLLELTKSCRLGR
jgi:hypothetical protein